MAAITTTEERAAEELLELMVRTGQRPGGGNLDFVEALERYIGSRAEMERIPDPTHPDRMLLVVHFGRLKDPQSLACLNHSDVVGITDQVWKTDPWTLCRRGERWYGRGVCDTHGCGTAMLLAGLRSRVGESLRAANRRVSLIFTFDEEATDQEFSMRGARLAVGDLGVPPAITAPYFIAGEPTEQQEKMVPMRGHKGRFLAQFFVKSARSGHVSERVQNALMAGARIVHEISEYGRMIQYGSRSDDEAAIFDPPFPTVQVTAAEVKRNDFSSTPDVAGFTLDMRTLPDTHDPRVRELIDLIETYPLDKGESVRIKVLKNAPGSMSPSDSPLVELAERVTGKAARGFNGGDEGRILRLVGNLQGVTLGPGELQEAHRPNESIKTKSLVEAVDFFADFFCRSAELPLDPPAAARR